MVKYNISQFPPQSHIHLLPLPYQQRSRSGLWQMEIRGERGRGGVVMRTAGACVQRQIWSASSSWD